MKQLFNELRILKNQNIKFQSETDTDLLELTVGETHSPVQTGSENSAVSLALRWSFKLDLECFNFM